MQRVKTKHAHCGICKADQKFERHVTAMGVGDLVMGICTCYLWILLRYAMSPPWRCATCGASEGKTGEPAKQQSSETVQNPVATSDESTTGTMPCIDCGGIVSKRADKCPHCGAPTGIGQ
jgi:hypothetical protein